MKSAGNILKQAREEKKISQAKVAEDTHFTLRQIEALENDNFSIFPGETYALGFLRAYANYLQLNPDHVIQVYRSSRIEESEIPIKELTKPVGPGHGEMIGGNAKTIFMAGSVILILAAGILLLATGKKGNTSQTKTVENGSLKSYLANSDLVPAEKTENVRLESGQTSAIISPGGGIDFSLQNTEVFIILRKLEKPEGAPARAEFEIYPGKTIVPLEEGASTEIGGERFSSRFKLTFDTATLNTVKILVQNLGEVAEATAVTEAEPDNIANPSNFIIHLEAEFTGRNYIDSFVDGKPGKKGMMSPGSRIQYEANNSIQLTVGDAGAVRIFINGKEESLGPRGRKVSKIIRKERDPVEQTKYKIVIKDVE